MSLRVELEGLPEDPSLVHVHAEVGGMIPRAEVRWRIAEPEEVPDGSSLIGCRMTVRFQRERVAREKPQFIGEVYGSTTRRLGSYRHELIALAATIPAKLVSTLDRRASWRTFERGAALCDVLTGLLEDAGFPDLSLEPAPSGSIPSQLVAAGLPAFDLALEVAAIHDYSMVVNPTEEPASSTKFGFVRTGSDLKELGGVVSAGVGGDGHVLLEVECSQGALAPEVLAPWMWVDEEKVFSAASTDRVLLSGSPWVTEEAAARVATGARAQLESSHLRLSARVREPFAGLGDTLEVVGSRSFGGALKSALAEGPIVYGLSWHDSEEDGSAVFHGNLQLASPSAPLPRPSLTFIPGRALSVLTGRVVAMPAQQGKMEVVLDAPEDAAGGKPPKVLVEWLSPWLSGEQGGLHFPPIPGDHVALLAESKPYGRIVYLGAHPSQERLDAIRKSFQEEQLVGFAQDRSGPIAETLHLGGDHLTRAIVTGNNNLMAWTAPRVGLGEDGVDIDAAAWQRLTASVGQSVLAAVPGKVAVEVTGGEAVVGARSEGSLGLYAEEKATVVGSERVELSGGIIDSESRETTRIVAAQDLEQKGENVRVEAQKDKTLQCQNLTHSVRSSAKIEAAKVEVTAQSSGKFSGATVDVEGSGPTNVKGSPLSLN